jgi:hypothetical protein
MVVSSPVTRLSRSLGSFLVLRFFFWSAAIYFAAFVSLFLRRPRRAKQEKPKKAAKEIAALQKKNTPALRHRQL